MDAKVCRSPAVTFADVQKLFAVLRNGIVELIKYVAVLQELPPIC